MLAFSWYQYKNSLGNNFLYSIIRLQAKATKKPYEAGEDFEKFLHNLVCFFLEIIENALSSFSSIDWTTFNKQIRFHTQVMVAG